jgi:hypothetical protein
MCNFWNHPKWARKEQDIIGESLETKFKTKYHSFSYCIFFFKNCFWGSKNICNSVLFNDIKKTLNLVLKWEKTWKCSTIRYYSDVSTLQQGQLELGSNVGPAGCWFQFKVPFCSECNAGTRTGSESGLQYLQLELGPQSGPGSTRLTGPVTLVSLLLHFSPSLCELSFLAQATRHRWPPWTRKSSWRWPVPSALAARAALEGM